MSNADIRKIVVMIEDTLVEGGVAVARPLRKVVAAAVIVNPFAGRFVQDLSSLFTLGEELGERLGRRAVEALGVEAAPQSYGKAALVGTDGEIEHGAAILHPKFGRPLRAAVGGGKAIIPSATKRGGPGASIDVPLHFKDEEWRFDNFDAIEIRVPDAPAANEILIAIAVTSAGRPHPRIGQARL
jgi:hypothetical protein